MIRSLILVWAGVVLGVSFLATPVKFQADTLTLPVAVDVGRATFHALMRVEWIFVAVVAGATVWRMNDIGTDAIVIALGAAVVAILAVQSFALLPPLDDRVERLIAGEELPGSWLHTTYAALEATKVAVLLGFAVAVGRLT